jgi:quercetin dioxygenase-like cupin family protein
MKFVPVVLCSVLFSAQVFSQGVPSEPAPALPRGKVSNIFVPEKSAITWPVAEWDVVQQAAGEQTGGRVLIAEGPPGVDKAPAGASKYTARAYKFPQGAMRTLTFKKADGPVIHQITFETELFMLQGSADVESQGKVVKLNAGDAISLPSGTLRNMKPKEDTVVLQYFVGSKAEKPVSKVVYGKDLKSTRIMQYEEGGKWITATTPEQHKKAPATAGIYDVKRYPFDGNSIRHAVLKKGNRTGPGTYEVDILIYINKGRMIRHEGGQTFEVVAGDAIREAKGQTGYWEMLEDSEFIASDAPFDPRVVNANP